MQNGGLTAHLEYSHDILQSIHDMAEMPQAAFGKGDVAGKMASGVALEILLQPVIHKTNRKRMIWTDALTRRAKMILRLGALDAAQEIRVNWPAILPRDVATEVANEIALVSGGIHSRETANRNLGEEMPLDEVTRAIDEAKRWAEVNPSGQHQGKPVQVSGALVQGLASAAG